MFSDHLLMLNVELEERECLSARKGGHHSLFHHYPKTVSANVLKVTAAAKAR